MATDPDDDDADSDIDTGLDDTGGGPVGAT